MSQSDHRPKVLIFGATGKIGSDLARQLATLGQGLTLAARRGGSLDALATELGTHSCPVDATDSSSVESCIAKSFEPHGRLEI